MPDEQDQVTLAAALERIDALFAAEADEGALESTPEDFGHYDGLPPRIELLDDGRVARLLEPIAYHRPDGTEWPVPAGSKLDGASIPRALWTLIGGPFEGKYRNASIVHDCYCDNHQRKWQHTHRMFYDAMRCSGVGSTKAGIMFYAVYRFGPRWPDPALESVGIEETPAFSEIDAQTLLRDAEAIAEHGLNAAEIAALAEARESSAALESLEAPPSAADLLVVPGGRGKPDDVAVVAAHARSLPQYVVARFTKKKVRIVACRDNVTDFERHLDGVTPRGWERTGRTWNSVPGCYFPDKKRVVIATILDAATGRRVIPDKASGLHGSDGLLVHESMHGYDFSLDHASRRDSGFQAARNADLGGLTEYELQQGDAGLEETFAETGAQHCVVPDVLAGRCPRLAGYWNAMPATTEAVAAPLEAPAEPGPLGLAVREADGRIRLDLRATDEGGAIGHATIELVPGDPHHATLDQALFPAGALESTADSEGRRTAPFFG
jgi:plasmid stabilization system protein ParE